MAKFRAVTEQDRPEIEAWIAADPAHADKVTADELIVRGRFHTVYAIGDEQGTVMYVKQEAEAHRMRLHVQFGPDKRRIIQALKEAYPFVAADAKARGFKQVVLDSTSPALVRWLMTEFGFVAQLEDEL